MNISRLAPESVFETRALSSIGVSGGVRGRTSSNVNKRMAYPRQDGRLKCMVESDRKMKLKRITRKQAIKITEIFGFI